MRAGDRLQINAQLISGETDDHLWGEIFERELTAENIFAVQREMATSIAGLLRASLSPEEQAELDRVPTQSEAALQAFYTGNEFARQPNERTNMPFAIEAYERAIEEDPNFAIAWAALARAHVQMYRMGGDRSAERASSATRALDRAQALAPDAPETHVALSQYEVFVTENYEAAIAEIEEALRRFPGSADVLNSLASTYRRVGRYEDSVAFRLRAMELDPRNTDALVSLGAGTYARMHDYDAAAATIDRALQILPDNPQLHWVSTLIPLWRDGDVSAIKALVAEPPVPLGRFGVRGGVLAAHYDRDFAAIVAMLEDLEPGIINNRNRLLWLGEAYQRTGREDEASRYFEELLEASTSSFSRDPNDVRGLVYQAAALAGLGQRDAAIEAGQNALELTKTLVDLDMIETIRENVLLLVFGPAGAVEPAVEVLEILLSNPGFFSIEGLLPDPGLDPIRDEPLFQALVARHRRASE